mmetsp:Transcript_9286/g.28015  ORF Transcript_9286/g.28015 Transcript_9286/m.28015 type:complete len:223 (-) Transcript_9286:526-1194(-)
MWGQKQNILQVEKMHTFLGIAHPHLPQADVNVQEGPERRSDEQRPVRQCLNQHERKRTDPRDGPSAHRAQLKLGEAEVPLIVTPRSERPRYLVGRGNVGSPRPRIEYRIEGRVSDDGVRLGHAGELGGAKVLSPDGISGRIDGPSLKFSLAHVGLERRAGEPHGWLVGIDQIFGPSGGKIPPIRYRFDTVDPTDYRGDISNRDGLGRKEEGCRGEVGSRRAG